MGVSTDAILAYGIPIPTESIPGNMTALQWQEAREVWDDDEITARGYDIVYHCSGDYPMHFLAVPGTKVIASRGYPEKIKAQDVSPLPSVTTDIYVRWQRAMYDLKIDRSEAGWYIFSMWT